MDSVSNMLEVMDESECIGVIGSPSSTGNLSIDILGSAVSRKLVGELALFRFQQDLDVHCALGQITEVELRNVWHEDATMRSLIRQRGRVDAVSERQDTHLGRMVVSAVFRKVSSVGYEPSFLGTVPPTGTRIHVVTDQILDELLESYRDQIFFLGRVYGSNPKLPLWFKHFDKGQDGAGEAYHLGIFGKTGSGKSVLAKKILLAYSRYPKMAVLVIDPQGEFARNFKNLSAEHEFALPLGEITKKLKKSSFVLSVQNLILDRWELFEQILYESLFFERLTVPKGENRRLACRNLSDRLKKQKVKLESLHESGTFEKAWELLQDDKFQRLFYRTEPTRKRFSEALQIADSAEFYKEYWGPVTELFKNRKSARSVDKGLDWLLRNEGKERPILVIDLSGQKGQNVYWNQKVQSLVIKRLIDGLASHAEKHYHEGKSLNTLVVIDEAHRLAPRYLDHEDAEAAAVRSVLIDAARTTRKYGLGWLFISQTLSSVHTEILQQLRIYFFGFGLGLGQEFQSLKQLVGSSGNALDLYQMFRDPHSSFDASSRQYSFMSIGPVSPLSFAGSPLFFNAFNTVEEFMEANGFK